MPVAVAETSPFSVSDMKKLMFSEAIFGGVVLIIKVYDRNNFLRNDVNLKLVGFIRVK